MNFHEQELAGQVVVVTGATGAVGRATVSALLREGASVAALGRRPDRLAALAVLDGVHTVSVDSRDEVGLAAAASEVRDLLGRPSALLAFAGGDGFPVPTADETPGHWRQVIEGDLTSTFLTVHAFLPDLVSHETSAIVTMASAAARRAGRSSAAYAAAKAGVIGLTRHLARELLPQGVRVSCLAPTAVVNDRIAALPSEHRRRMDQHLPFGRAGEPEEVAEAAVYLASRRSSYLTGVVLDLGGQQL